MKKLILYVISVLLLSSVVLFSCEKEPVSNPSSSVTVTPSDYVALGVEHNTSLDYLHQEIEKHQDQILLDQNGEMPEFPEVFVTLTKKFVAESDFFEGNISLAKQSIDEVANKVRANFFEENYDVFKEDVLDGLSLTAFQRNIINQVIAVLNTTTSVNLMQQKINEINDDILAKAKNDDEAGLLFAATSIARSSFEYWSDQENKEKWQALEFGIISDTNPYVMDQFVTTPSVQYASVVDVFGGIFGGFAGAGICGPPCIELGVVAGAAFASGIAIRIRNRRCHH